MQTTDAQRGWLVVAGAALAAAVVAVAVVLLPDTVATIGLFVLLTPPAVFGAGGFGAFMLMLGDGAPKSPVSIGAVLAAVVGPALGTIVFFAAAVVVATQVSGPTFYLPLVALAASVLWSLALPAGAAWAIRVFG